MQSRLRSRLALWGILAIVVVALAAAGGASLASGDSSTGTSTQTVHFLLREDQQVLDRAPAGPSNGDLVLLRGDLLNPKTRAVVGTEVGMYVMVDAANQNRSAANIVFTPNARTNLAQADQIAVQTLFDSVPGTLVSAITGGTGKYKNARGQVVAKDGPDGLIDVVIHLTTP
jgi:hypothetical protein